jgi:hypothetical protein
MAILKYINMLSSNTGHLIKYYLPNMILANNGYAWFGSSGVSYTDYRNYIDQYIEDITAGSAFYDSTDTTTGSGKYIAKYFPYAIDINTELPINGKITKAKKEK